MNSKLGELLGNVIVGILVSMLIVFTVFALFCLFVYLPVTAVTEANCLRKGYPKAVISIYLERYCANLDGSVTVKVDKQ